MAGSIRSVAESDVDAVVGLVHELAAYERMAEQCRLTPARLHTALFGAEPALFGHVAHVDSAVAGVALWSRNFSTWDGVPGIYVEDIFVRPEYRGDGLGRALLSELAAESVRRGYSRLEWSVLDWNELAIGFYHSIGAEPMDEWTVYRVAGEALTGLAGDKTPNE